jgi:MFS family permease
MADLGFALRALKSRNYRLFFLGQTVSLIGTWMTRIATSWLVYRLTESPVLLGLSGFAGQLPSFLLAPIAGVLVDRWDRHRTLIVTQILSMVQSALLAWLALAHIITVWEIIWLSAFQGAVNAFDMPARQSLLVRMIDRREDLPNAIALNSSMVNATRLVGPAVAGVLIAGVGEAYCFLIDAISYIAVVASLLLMRLDPEPVRKAARGGWEDLKEGWRYVTGSVAIRSILINLAIVSLFGMPYSTLMPIFASQTLHGSAHTLGFLMSASGVGALAGAVSLAMRRSVIGLGRQIVVDTAAFGAALIVFAFSRSLWLSLVSLVFAGAGMMQQMAASNTILQTIVDEEKRGRVMAFYSMAFVGMTPFGSLLAGALADRIGAPWTVAWSGVACLAGSLWFALRLREIRKFIRPIYVRLGILPEAAFGVEQAAIVAEPQQT